MVKKGWCPLAVVVEHIGWEEVFYLPSENLAGDSRSGFKVQIPQGRVKLGDGESDHKHNIW